MNITYKIVNIQDYKKVPMICIEKEGEKCWALQDVLNVDIDTTNLNDLINEIKNVEQGKSKIEKFSSQRCMIDISLKECKAYDLFDFLPENEIYPTINLLFEEFKNIVINWKIKREKLLQQINNE